MFCLVTAQGHTFDTLITISVRVICIQINQHFLISIHEYTSFTLPNWHFRMAAAIAQCAKAFAQQEEVWVFEFQSCQT